MGAEIRKRRKGEELRREIENKTLAASAKREADIAEYNKAQTESSFSLTDVVGSLVKLYERREDLTDVRWRMELKAWQIRFDGKRVSGQGKVFNVRSDALIILEDADGLRFRYSIGPHDDGYSLSAKDSMVRFDGKLHAAWSDDHFLKLTYTRTLYMEDMFTIAGWK